MFHVTTILDIYKAILEGDLSRFDRGTWTLDQRGKGNFIKCFRYLILEHLKWSKEQAIQNMSEMEVDFFRMWNLRTPLEKYYKYNFNRAFKEAFPEWTC